MSFYANIQALVSSILTTLHCNTCTYLCVHATKNIMWLYLYMHAQTKLSVKHLNITNKFYIHNIRCTMACYKCKHFFTHDTHMVYMITPILQISQSLLYSDLFFKTSGATQTSKIECEDTHNSSVFINLPI